MGRKKQKSPPFIMLPKEMIRSKAWQELSHYSIRAYIEIACKFNGKNQKNLSFTYKEASKVMHRQSYAKAIRELDKYGFINIERRGGLYNRCNIFSLSERWMLYGKPLSEFRAHKDVDPQWKP